MHGSRQGSYTLVQQSYAGQDEGISQGLHAGGWSMRAPTQVLQRGGTARRYKRATCCPHGSLSFVVARVGQEQAIRAIEERLIKSLRPKENSDFQQRRRQMMQAVLGLRPPRRRPPKGGRAQPESCAPPRQANLPEYMVPARGESRQHQQAGWSPGKCLLPREADLVSISSLKYNDAYYDADA